TRCGTAARSRSGPPRLAQPVDEVRTVGGIDVRIGDFPPPLCIFWLESLHFRERHPCLFRAAELAVTGGEGTIQRVEGPDPDAHAGNLRGLLVPPLVIVRQREDV